VTLLSPGRASETSGDKPALQRDALIRASLKLRAFEPLLLFIGGGGGGGE